MQIAQEAPAAGTFETPLGRKKRQGGRARESLWSAVIGIQNGSEWRSLDWSRCNCSHNTQLPAYLVLELLFVGASWFKPAIAVCMLEGGHRASLCMIKAKTFVEWRHDVYVSTWPRT